MSRLLGTVVISLMVLATGAAAADVPPHASPPTIRVVARATVRAKPDQAEIELGVTTDRKKAAAAVSDNQQKMEKVLAAVKKELGADGEVRTSEVSVHPRVEETRTGTPTGRVLGYTATNVIHVRFANIKAVGGLLDVAFQAGANSAEELAFTMKDPDAAQNQALREASAKARARATAMAEGQGLRVGDVVSVTEGQSYDDSNPVEGLVALRANEMANANRTSIVSGSIAVTATVTVVFALKPR